MSNNKQDYEEVWNTVSETTELDIFKAYGVLEEPEDKGETPEQDPKPDSIPTDGSPATSAATQPEAASVSGEADPKSEDQCLESKQESGGTGGTVRTEAGLIDPETGEVVEESFILAKLGWTEMPDLPNQPTAAQIEQFEDKVDQLVDRVLGYEEKAARYRAAAEARCKHLDGAAAFWTENFLIPMAKKLGPHKLKKFKSGANAGQYNGKTMNLASGSIGFTKAGGWGAPDSDLIKAHIKKVGIENFESINAKDSVSYDYQKLIAELNAGNLKQIPGTKYSAPDEFAKVEIKIPTAPKKKEEAKNGNQ